MSNFDPKYPIGKSVAMPFSTQTKNEWIEAIQLLPGDLEFVCQGLDKSQLDTPYREGGWTVHQLVHHVADSHMNAFARFKLALTEEVPKIKTYEEKEWVLTADVMEMPINYSITLLFSLHARWAKLLESITDEQWQRKLFHPAKNAEVTLWDLLTIYAWHGKHHVAHIKMLKEQKGW